MGLGPGLGLWVQPAAGVVVPPAVPACLQAHVKKQFERTHYLTQSNAT
jgi:hypothetical protein